MSEQTTDATVTSPLGQDDPRSGFAVVTDALGGLMEAIETGPAAALDGPTPCPDFTVTDLLDHVVMVMRRVAVIGAGEHFSTVQHEALGAGWTAAYREAAHDVMEAWMDPAKLEAVFEVPWGSLPGAPLILTYTGELAVHGWDLATATGRELTIDDAVLQGALVAARFVPAEGRDAPDIPFGPIVDPGQGAPVLLQLAGWLGRAVAG